MRPLPASLAHAALSTPTAIVRAVTITLTRGVFQTQTFEPDGGTFTQDARRSMRWNGSLTLSSPSLIPTGPEDILTPFGTVVAVDLGVRVGDEVSQVAFGRYLIDSSTVTIAPNARTVELTLVDLAERVTSYRFETPFVVPAGTDLADAVSAVIHNRTGIDPGLGAEGVTLARQRVFGLDPEKDPWRELRDLVSGFGRRLWYSRDGQLVLDVEPIADRANANELTGPVTVTGRFERRPPNVVVARGEAAEDSPPIQAVAMDLDPLSPTYAGLSPADSPYGRITRYFSSPLLSTTAQAAQAANTILASSAGAGATWQLGRAFDPTWDPDDVILVDVLDEPLIVMADAVTVNLTEGTTIDAREPSELIDTVIGS